MTQRPTHLRDFELVELLGEGGMGEVYRARHRLLEQDYAVKAVHTSLGESPEVRARFLREAQTLSKLDHPNLLRFVSLFEEEGRLYMVTELLDGRPLDQRMAESPRPSLAQRAHWLTQIVRGVAHAHRRGVLHRDLKPANLQVLADDRVKVLDFGIAKPIAARGLTASGHLVGTPVYLPPEIVLGEKASSVAGPTWDVYTLGVVAYELFAGRLPFEINPATPALQLLSDLSRLHGQRRPVPNLEALCPELSPEWASVVMRAISAHPGDRPRDAGALLEALDGAAPLRAKAPLERLGADLAPEDATQITRLVRVPRPAETETVVQTLDRPQGRRRRAVGWLAAAGLAFAAMGIGVWLARGLRDEPQAQPAVHASVQRPSAGPTEPPSAAPTEPPTEALAQVMELEPMALEVPTVAPPPQARSASPRSTAPRPARDAANPVGYLFVEAEPPALVYLDDRFVGPTPVKGHWVRPGNYEVKLYGVRPFQYTARLSARIKAGEKTALRHREAKGARSP